jgi:hypothetical protein
VQETAANAAILATGPPVAQPSSMTGDSGNDRPKNDRKARERARLAAALRENLKRRKAQARGRAADDASDGPDKPHDSAGIRADKSSG